MIFFKNRDEFREWLQNHYKTKKELVVGFYKTKTGKPSMTWSESVDQALCFGWIDGIRRSIDDVSYSIRFTPRNPNSVWSSINIKKVEELTQKGLMTPEGLDAFNKRKPEKSGIYSFENKPGQLTPEMESQFKKETAAWDFFNLQAPSYRRTVIHWILSAKTETTRQNRLSKLIEASSDKKRLF
ncbi:MAG TPA: YdeI/OmpD-associated family protein [Bacteroidales bacterium]|nr:YdeI/OmpD-associated family protein [Bacteroidales bacterium]